MESCGVSSLQNLQALSALLNPPQQREEEDEETPKPCANLNPGNIGPKPKKETPVSSVSSSKDIWSEEEVSEGSQFDLEDPRPQPEYEVVLRQSVGTEDVFLGLSGKNPSSMSCEALLVRVKLPDTKQSDVVLDVKETFFDLRTPQYKLGFHLPHPVHSEKGRAQFSSKSEELGVTLPIKRSMDFLNGR